MFAALGPCDPRDVLRIVCLSDTHGMHDQVEVPSGDVLVHAGDFTKRGTLPEVGAFAEWLRGLPHAEKVVVAGNHDFLFEREGALARSMLEGATYLEDREALVAGLSVWGSPWQPWFHGWAFNLPRGQALAEKWSRVPEGVDLLVTHGPPWGVLDRIHDGERVGCEELAAALRRVRPRVHVFGHIHDSYGVATVDGVLSINACTCDPAYRPVNPPIVVEWSAGGVQVVAS